MSDVVRFVSGPVGPGGDSLSKCEQAVLTLAMEDPTVGRLVEMIPNPDAEVLRAILFLIDLGSITIVAARPRPRLPA
jgi:hypothetical protein